MLRLENLGDFLTDFIWSGHVLIIAPSHNTQDNFTLYSDPFLNCATLLLKLEL